MHDNFEDFHLWRPRSAQHNPNVFLGAFTFYFFFIEQVPSFSCPGSIHNVPAASSASETISEPPSRKHQRGDEDAYNSS